MSLIPDAKTEARLLFEVLALMTIGACWWFIAASLGVLDALGQFALRHELVNLMLLGLCIGSGGIAAVVRTTLRLRRAIAARVEAEAVAERLARQDPLTGLGNRRYLSEKLTAMLAEQGEGRRLAALLIDLDRFKPVNDAHGHAAGNAVLSAVAERLLKATPADGVVARLGGDEFVVLTSAFSAEAELGDLAQRIIDAIRRPIPWGRGYVDVDATIGVAIAGARTKEPEQLLHAADVAMYQGKRQGRGVYRFFREEMDQALKARARLESELRAAIAADAITPYYQPIVSLPEREIVGFEALARWVDPYLGEIPPQTFIPIAEECGLISDLFFRVLKRACLDARSWPGHIRLAVNLSPYQIQDPQLPGKMLAALTQTRFPAQRLEVELTERALVNDIEAARVALASLHNLGIGISLDNFGAGYSILHHLNEMRFTTLKIDRSYVAGLKAGGERATLVDAILRLSANLSLRATAEGIETPENLEWLASRGCSYAQGYLFGRAMSSRDAANFIARVRHQKAREAQAAHGR